MLLQQNFHKPLPHLRPLTLRDAYCLQCFVPPFHVHRRCSRDKIDLLYSPPSTLRHLMRCSYKARVLLRRSFVALLRVSIFAIRRPLELDRKNRLCLAVPRYTIKSPCSKFSTPQILTLTLILHVDRCDDSVTHALLQKCKEALCWGGNCCLPPARPQLDPAASSHPFPSKLVWSSGLVLLLLLLRCCCCCRRRRLGACARCLPRPRAAGPCLSRLPLAQSIGQVATFEGAASRRCVLKGQGGL
jgi:hypothetical protein